MNKKEVNTKLDTIQNTIDELTKIVQSQQIQIQQLSRENKQKRTYFEISRKAPQQQVSAQPKQYLEHTELTISKQQYLNEIQISRLQSICIKLIIQNIQLKQRFQSNIDINDYQIQEILQQNLGQIQRETTTKKKLDKNIVQFTKRFCIEWNSLVIVFRLVSVDSMEKLRLATERYQLFLGDNLCNELIQVLK